MYILVLYSYVVYLLCAHMGLYNFKGIPVYIYLFVPLILYASRLKYVILRINTFSRFSRFVYYILACFTVLLGILSYSFTLQTTKVHVIDIMVYANYIVFIGIVAAVKSYIDIVKLTKYLSVLILLYFTYAIIISYIKGTGIHNAYYGMIMSIILSQALYQIDIAAKMSFRIFWMIVVSLAIIFPIISSLRGATFFTVLILLYYLFSKRLLNFIVNFAFAVAFIFVLAPTINEYISETGRYGNETFYDMFDDYTLTEANLVVRTDWWINALVSVSNKPFGYKYSYTFTPFYRYTSGSGMLHNLFISAAADCGYSYALLFLLLFIMPITLAFRLSKRGIYSPYAGWIISIFGCMLTNGYGFVLSYSGITGILFGLAYVSLNEESKQSQIRQAGV